MGDGGAGRDDKPNAAISAAGLKIPEQKRKVPPKDSLKHEADWDLDISSMRVLLVEDNLMNQKVATVSMAACNVTTHIADNGKIACDAYKQILTGDIPPYDVIFMDQMMPIMNGTEATVCIREMESEARKQFENGELAKEPPASALIVGLSANVGPEHVSAIQKAGMDGTLSKPFYPSTLRGLLRDVYLGRYMGFREADSGYAKNAQAKPGN
jgi:CheY-like chemotaxis protein